jgi:hypothetical protein
MKSIAAAGIMIAISLASPAGRADLVLAVDGTTSYRIVVSDTRTAAVDYAAAELQRFLHDISGAPFEIVPESKAGKGPAILLGPSRRVGRTGLVAAANTLRGDGVLIKTVGRDLVLLGDGERGLLNSVYVFLERYLDCRFLAHDCTVAPPRRSIELSPIDYRHSPPFIYREVLAFDAARRDFAARQKLNGGNMQQVLAPAAAASGETIPGILIFPFVHTFAAIAPTEAYFQSHPEYFGLIKGKRQGGNIGGQLCLTNPDVLEMAKRKALEWIALHPDLTTVDISQNDAYPGSSGACECEACAAIVREEGSQNGPILRFVNAVADAVKEKYPGKFVDTLAYDYTIIPPKITKPRDNVIIRLCHYGCYFHGIEGEELSKDFQPAVIAWPKLAKHVWIWHYGTNFWHYLAPNPNLESLVKDIRFYAANGIDGLMMQADIQSPGGEMAELRQYLASQMMWDPGQDPMAIRSDFCRGYYGPAAGEALEYLALMDAWGRSVSKHIPTNGWKPPDVTTPEFIAAGLEILNRGLAKTADASIFRGRMEKMLLPLWYVRLAWPDVYGLAKEEGRALLAEFKRVVKAFAITNRTEGPSGDIDGFLAEMEARYGSKP